MITSEKIKFVCVVGEGRVVHSRLEKMLGLAQFGASTELSILKTREDVFSRISSGRCDVLILPIDWSRASSIDLAIRARVKSTALTLIAFHDHSLQGELIEAMESVVDEYWDTRRFADFDIGQSLELALERRALLCDLANELQPAKEHIERLDKELHAANSKPEPLGGLTGGLAHNLNNLMMGVLGNAELLKNDFELDNLTLDRLKKLESSAQKASDLCQRLLSFSGQGNLAVQRFDLSKLFGDLREILLATMPEGTNVLYSIASDLPFIHGDPTEIRQLILNLAVNAGEAIEANGSVSISCGKCQLSKADIAAMLLPGGLQAGEHLCLEIEDDGPGIESSMLNEIFEPFFTTKSDGRGLGLPASLGIVKAHSGALDVSSGEEGTSVKVFFPIEVAKTETDDFGESEQKNDPVMNRVLVVDDEDVLRMVVSSLLKLFGYEPVVAANGEDALDLYAKEDDWAFAMIDLNMPGMSGADLYSKIKNDSPRLPILVMSGDGEEPEVLQELLATNDSSGYLMKPFGMEDLRTAISDLIELPNAG